MDPLYIKIDREIFSPAAIHFKADVDGQPGSVEICVSPGRSFFYEGEKAEAIVRFMEENALDLLAGPAVAEGKSVGKTTIIRPGHSDQAGPSTTRSDR